MKYFLLVLWLLCSNFYLAAQEKSKIDSLENLIESYHLSGDDSLLNMQYHNLFSLFANRNMHKAIETCYRGIELGTKTGNYKISYDWYLKLGLYYSNTGQPQKALNNYQKALEISNKYDYETGWAYISIGNFFYANKQFTNAINFYVKAIDSFKATEQNYNRNESLGQSVALNNIGLSYTELGQKHDALKCFFEAFEIRKKYGDEYYLAHSCMLIGEHYQHIGNLDSAFAYTQQGIEVADSIGNKNQKIDLLKMLVKISEKQQNIEVSQNKKKLAFLNRDFENLTNISKTRAIIAAILIGALLIGVVLLIIIIRKNRKVSEYLKHDKRIAESKAAIADILKLSVDSKLSYKEFFQKTLETIIHISWLSVENRGAIFTIKNDGSYEMTAEINMGNDRIGNCNFIEPGKCICGEVLKTNKAIIGNQYRTKFEDKHSDIPYKHMKLPISIGNEVLGLLNLYQKNDANLSDIDMDFFRNLSWSLAGVIKQKNLKLKLENQNKELDKLSQKIFAQSLSVDQQNIETKHINAELKKQKQALSKANATKDKFFSIIAHDLKNPFNTILGFSQIMSANIDEYDKKKIKQFVHHINSSAKSAYRLLENLLQWSRAQQGEIKFRPKDIELKPLITETIALLKGQANAKQIFIETNVSENLTLFADSDMIKTIVRNLISNAIKFTPVDGKVIVSANYLDENVVLTIEDTGTGMSEKIKSTLFKIDKSQSTVGTDGEKGTGLGLLLCKEFTDKHKGTITVESELNVGSRFIITLPKTVQQE